MGCLPAVTEKKLVQDIFQRTNLPSQSRNRSLGPIRGPTGCCSGFLGASAAMAQSHDFAAADGGGLLRLDGFGGTFNILMISIPNTTKKIPMLNGVWGPQFL